MHRIAVIDDDERWCFTIQRYFRNDFEVTTFKGTASFLREHNAFDLIIIDFCIPPARHEVPMDGCELIVYLKKKLINPPILVLATGFISRNDVLSVQQICPAADAFMAKDAGLDVLLEQTKQLLMTQRMVEKG